MMLQHQASKRILASSSSLYCKNCNSILYSSNELQTVRFLSSFRRPVTTQQPSKNTKLSSTSQIKLIEQAPIRLTKRKLSTEASEPTKNKTPESVIFVKAGLPFLLFIGGAAYVLSAAIEGKNKEREYSQGSSMSKSERQYKMDQEKDQMMKKMQVHLRKDFDNTKRIERPEEVLARRKKERDERNKWYRRLGRWWRGEN